MKILKRFTILRKLPGNQISCRELNNTFSYIRCGVFKTFRDAQKQFNHVNAVAIEEIGHGIVYVKESL